MDDRKAKYSLFPAPPLSNSKPSSAIRHPSPAPTAPPAPPQHSSVSHPQHLTSLPDSSPPSPALPLPSDTHDPPSPPGPNQQVASDPHQQPPHRPRSPVPPSEMTVSSFSTNSESSLKPAPSSLPSFPQQPRKLPRRAFIRHGLGGAGNYHKRPDIPPSSDYSGFLSSLLGTFNKKRRPQQCPDGDPTECSQYSSQALPLGAAEVLKRKMLGQTSGRKRSTSGDRS